MHSNSIQVTGRSLAYELPQGDLLFSNISFSWAFAKCALVGPNGVGKSTLAKILSGQLAVTTGDLLISAPVTYLEQLAEPPTMTTAEYLAELWESPTADPQIWGPLLADIPLEGSLTHLSGGQWTRVRIAHALIQPQGLLILDEPTNNLDRSARSLIVDFVRHYGGALLLISHDRELLNVVDGIWELSSQGLSVYGGNFAFYEEEKIKERAHLADKIERARKEKKKVEREHHEKLEAQEKRMRRGQKIADRGGLPRILVGGLKRRAQETHAKIHNNETKRSEQAQENLRHLVDQQKMESNLHPFMIDTSLPEGKLVLECQDFNLRYEGGDYLWPEPLSFTLKGPGTWVLRGPNGVGKSSLLKYFMQQLQEDSIEVTGLCHRGSVASAYLDQHYTILDKEKTVFENVMETSRYDTVETRNFLARFQFMKESVLQKVDTLSGGERLKACLAKIFLMKPVPQLLILDEPTNNLDLDSLATLEEFLSSYGGALIVVSHDEVFLERIGVTGSIDLKAK